MSRRHRKTSGKRDAARLARCLMRRMYAAVVFEMRVSE